MIVLWLIVSGPPESTALTPFLATLPRMTLFEIVSGPRLSMPAPVPNRNPPATFPSTLVRSSVREASGALKMPPPVRLAVLPETALSTSVSVPALTTPPPVTALPSFEGQPGDRRLAPRGDPEDRAQGVAADGQLVRAGAGDRHRSR